MPLGRVIALTLAVLLTPALPAYAAAEPVPTTLTLATEPSYADTETTATLRQATENGPVVGASVTVERRVDGEWAELAVLTTDEEGRAGTSVELRRDASDNVLRASYAGDEVHAPSETGRVAAAMRRREGVVRIDAPGSVVDEERVVIRVRRTTRTGVPVPGRVELWRRLPGEDWKRFGRPVVGSKGVARVQVTPRVDTRWRARAAKLDWVTGDHSPVRRIDNLPPGVPVALPAGAPRPRVNLPDQPRAVGDGPHPRISPIPDGIWNQMTGRSWHQGCPVGRAGLRLLRVNYWAYDGYRHRGELVAHADAIGRMRDALVEMYHRRLPMRSMYRVDRFGWSGRLRGADDYRSMAAGNTSAFNCRDVVGRPGVRSPHAWGRSLDVNPWENPYRSSGGWVPNSWWVGRSHPRVAWRSRSHVVVQVMARHGLRWTYGTGDAHHFDAVPRGASRGVDGGAPDLPEVCERQVCH